MNLMSIILVFGCFTVLCAIQTSDNKKLAKRITALENKVLGEDLNEKSN